MDISTIANAIRDAKTKASRFESAIATLEGMGVDHIVAELSNNLAVVRADLEIVCPTSTMANEDGKLCESSDEE